MLPYTLILWTNVCCLNFGNNRKKKLIEGIIGLLLCLAPSNCSFQVTLPGLSEGILVTTNFDRKIKKQLKDRSVLASCSVLLPPTDILRPLLPASPGEWAPWGDQGGLWGGRGDYVGEGGRDPRGRLVTSCLRPTYITHSNCKWGWWTLNIIENPNFDGTMSNR